MGEVITEEVYHNTGEVEEAAEELLEQEQLPEGVQLIRELTTSLGLLQKKRRKKQRRMLSTFIQMASALIVTSST